MKRKTAPAGQLVLLLPVDDPTLLVYTPIAGATEPITLAAVERAVGRRKRERTALPRGGQAAEGSYVW